MSVGKRIQDARVRKGYSKEKLAEKVGVSRTTVSNWEKDDHHPTAKQIPKLVKALELPPAAFNRYGAGGVGPVTPPERGAVLIPLIEWGELDLITAGKLSIAKLRQPRLVEAAPATPEHWVALQVADDSMAPVFHSGERVYIDPSLSPQEGDYVVARIRPGDHVLRTYRGRRDGAYDLVAEKGGYDTVSVNSGKADAKVIGVVVEHHRRLRR